MTKCLMRLNSSIIKIQTAAIHPRWEGEGWGSLLRYNSDGDVQSFEICDPRTFFGFKNFGVTFLW